MGTDELKRRGGLSIHSLCTVTAALPWDDKPRVETFPMAEANRALDHTRQGKARFRAVLVA